MATLIPANRKAFNKMIAKLDPVQAAISAEANTRAGIARGVLAAHRDTGASSIIVESGAVDRYVTLVAGTGDARSIEFGRNGARGKGTSTGVGALQAALGAG
jgi:hypothetical protein